MLVGGELLDAFARFELDRHDLRIEIAAVDRAGGLLVGFNRELVLLLARKAVLGGDILGGDAHVAVAERIVQRRGHRVDRGRVSHALTPAARRQHVGGAAHALGAAGNRGGAITEQDVLRGRDDGLQTRAA